MTNTESVVRTLVTVVLTLCAALGLLWEPVTVLAPAEDVVSSSWNCLRDMGYVGDVSDPREALYPARIDAMRCGI